MTKLSASCVERCPVDAPNWRACQLYTVSDGPSDFQQSSGQNCGSGADCTEPLCSCITARPIRLRSIPRESIEADVDIKMAPEYD